MKKKKKKEERAENAIYLKIPSGSNGARHHPGESGGKGP